MRGPDEGSGPLPKEILEDMILGRESTSLISVAVTEFRNGERTDRGLLLWQVWGIFGYFQESEKYHLNYIELFRNGF